MCILTRMAAGGSVSNVRIDPLLGNIAINTSISLARTGKNMAECLVSVEEVSGGIKVSHAVPTERAQSARALADECCFYLRSTECAALAPCSQCRCTQSSPLRPATLSEKRLCTWSSKSRSEMDRVRDARFVTRSGLGPMRSPRSKQRGT